MGLEIPEVHELSSTSREPRATCFFCLEAHSSELILENYRLISIHEHSILDMRPHSAREDNFFEVSPLADEVLDSVAVGDADYVLLNDRAVVEDFGHVVAGGPDQFDTTLEGLMVGASPDEGRQE